MFPIISVIIPVYNTEKYLDKCLNSVAIQSFKNFEVIIIDDGSSDNSFEIIKKYCRKYNNFSVTVKEKSNVSDCRNTALKLAKGEYIAFIDSDDFVSPLFLETLYKAIKKSDADIVNCGYNIVNTAKGVTKKYGYSLSDGIYSKPKILKILICDTRVNYYIWNKLFKRSLIEANNITFPKMCFEDTAFCVRTFYYADKIATVSNHLYYYVKHSDSLVNSVNESKLNDYILALADTRIFLENNNDFKSYRISFFLHSIRILFVTFENIFFIHKTKHTYSKLFPNLMKAITIILYLNGTKVKALSNIKEFNKFIAAE